MRVAVPTEIKNNENRVAMTPAAVDALVRRGHTVTVQRGAGLGVGVVADPPADGSGRGEVADHDVLQVWRPDSLQNVVVRLPRGLV